MGFPEQINKWQYTHIRASQTALAVKNLPTNARDLRDEASIPGWGRCPGEGPGNPLQSSCLENPMDRRAWQATVHGVTKGQTRLKQLSTHTHILPHTTPHTLHHTFTCYTRYSYHSRKKKQLLIQTTVWMNLTHVMWRERNQTQKSPLGESNVGEVQTQENCVTGIRRRVAFGSWVLSGRSPQGGGNILQLELGSGYMVGIFTLKKS